MGVKGRRAAGWHHRNEQSTSTTTTMEQGKPGSKARVINAQQQRVGVKGQGIRTGAVTSARSGKGLRRVSVNQIPNRHRGQQAGASAFRWSSKGQKTVHPGKNQSTQYKVMFRGVWQAGRQCGEGVRQGGKGAGRQAGQGGNKVVKRGKARGQRRAIVTERTINAAGRQRQAGKGRRVGRGRQE